MAITRANAQNSKSSAKFDAKLKATGVKKNSFKVAPTRKNLLNAAKLQSKNEKGKNADLKMTEQLLKLCRPISIYLTQIKPEQTMKIPVVDSKFSFL